jgi:mannose-6-phosphate isomerase-like protein (cupin superfamily)
MKPVSIANAEHYSWGSSCDGWHLLRNPSLSVIQERVPAGQAEAMHYHRLSRQFFFIIDGFAVMQLSGTEIPLAAGDGLEIPPGIPHRFLNKSGTDVVFLVISSPPSHQDRIDLDPA